MRCLTLPLLCCMVLVPISPAPAQESTHSIAWPAAFSAGSFGEVAGGSFTGNHHSAVLVRRGGDLYYGFHPTLFAAISHISLGAPCYGIAVLPGDSVQPRDRMVVSTSTGVRLGRLEGTTFHWSAVLDAQWSGARGLTVAEDAAGTRWLAAIDALGQDVRTAYQPYAGGGLVAGITVNVSQPIADVVPVDWDGDGDLDFAVLTSQSLRVYDDSGAQVATVLATLASNTAMARVRTPADEWLAVVNGGTSLTLTLWKAGTVQSAPVDTSDLVVGGSLDVTGLASADMDGDGDDDLMLSQSGSPLCKVIEYPITGDQVTTQVTATQPGGIPNLAPPLWMDLNFDGLPEGVFALDSTQTIEVVKDLDLLPFTAPSVDLVSNAYYDWTTLGLDLSATLAGNANTLQIVVWHQDDPYQTPVPPLDNVAVKTVTSTLTAPTDGVYQVGFALAPSTPGATSWPNRDHYYLETRFLDTQSDTVVYEEVVGTTMIPGNSTFRTDYLESLSVYAGPDPKVPVFMSSLCPSIGVVVLQEIPPPVDDTNGPPDDSGS